jgi:hypothetical protein
VDHRLCPTTLMLSPALWDCSLLPFPRSRSVSFPKTFGPFAYRKIAFHFTYSSNALYPEMKHMTASLLSLQDSKCNITRSDRTEEKQNLSPRQHTSLSRSNTSAYSSCNLVATSNRLRGGSLSPQLIATRSTTRYHTCGEILRLLTMLSWTAPESP